MNRRRPLVRHPRPSIHALFCPGETGVTLVELLVTVTLTAALTAAVLSAYLSVSRQNRLNQSLVEMIDGATLALRFLADDARSSGAYEFQYIEDSGALRAAEAASGCISATSDSWPATAPILILTGAGNTAPTLCSPPARATNDQLLLLNRGAHTPQGQDNRHRYLYYIGKQTGISPLGCRYNTALFRTSYTPDGSQSTEELVPGAERVFFLVGLDSDQNGDVDQYVAPATDTDWSSVLAIKISLAVRSSCGDPSVDLSKSYEFGGSTWTPGDPFRRIVVSRVVTRRAAGV